MRFKTDTYGNGPLLGLTEMGDECGLTVGFVGSVEFSREDKAALAAHLRAAAALLDSIPGSSPERHTYTVQDGPKMLRETLCVAQSSLWRGAPSGSDSDLQRHAARLGRLIDECDRKRPLGPDGKHDERHTAECGCDD